MKTHRGADLEKNISFGASDRHWQLDVPTVNYGHDGINGNSMSILGLAQGTFHKVLYTLLPLPPPGQGGSQDLRMQGPWDGKAWSLQDPPEGCTLVKVIHIGCLEK